MVIMASGKGLGWTFMSVVLSFPPISLLGINLLCRMGRSKESIFLLNFWQRITVPGSVWELGPLKLRMLFLHIWWKDIVLIFILSTCSQLFSTNCSYQSYPLCTLQSLLWENTLLFSLDNQEALFSVLLRSKASLF